MSLLVRTVNVTTTGGDGSASGTGATAVPKGCELLAIYLNYHASAPGTTDVTVTAAGDPADQTVDVVSNNATDRWEYPRVQVRTNAGALVTGAYDKFVIHNGILTIALAQADALTNALVATCLFRT